jgi:hypothetical protein
VSKSKLLAQHHFLDHEKASPEAKILHEKASSEAKILHLPSCHSFPYMLLLNDSAVALTVPDFE